MFASTTLDTDVMSQLSDAIVKSLRRAPLRAPVVFEENDCIVVEMPAQDVGCDELELTLEDDIVLRVEEPSGTCSAKIILPEPVSLSDSVVYCVGGVLTMTFVKADAIEALAEADVETDEYDEELLAS